MAKCIIGETLQEECNLISEGFNRKAGFHKIADISLESQQLITLRSGVNISASDDTTLCYYHEKIFLSRYESLQRFCCDPFNKHKKHITSKCCVCILAVIHSVVVTCIHIYKRGLGGLHVNLWRLWIKYALVLY